MTSTSLQKDLSSHNISLHNMQNHNVMFKEDIYDVVDEKGFIKVKSDNYKEF